MSTNPKPSPNTVSSAASHPHMTPEEAAQADILKDTLHPFQREVVVFAAILDIIKVNLVPGGVAEFETTWMPYVRACVTDYYSVLSYLPKVSENLGIKLMFHKMPILIHFEELMNQACMNQEGLRAEHIYALNPFDPSVVASGKPISEKHQDWVLSTKDLGEEEEGDRQEEHSEYESNGVQMEAPTDLSFYNVLAGFRGYDMKWTKSLTHVFKYPCTGCTDPDSCCALYRLPTTLAPSVTCLYCKAKKRRCICSSDETIPNPHYNYTAKPVFIKKIDNKGSKPKVWQEVYVEITSETNSKGEGSTKAKGKRKDLRWEEEGYLCRASVKTIDYPDPKYPPQFLLFHESIPKLCPPGGGSFVSQFQHDTLKHVVDAL
ncbi:hypothetical protein JAAARDRAFT_189953 [Jaapia argillacea MUCL 33604]|uniref:Uncharacterized protein n=1 Tax=Jaapia argillacea MUCL 33604 TaxID=933084 RepID=A0A067Q8Z9_9AGAM|nr:hypothetical protein JAAARDRAFT_189953 [Jaapia argillacea MUCL 33604]